MVFLACLLLLGAFCTSDALGKDYFTAAVFEHRPRANIADKTPAEIKEINLKYYKNAVLVASTKGVDILVFNEFGLFTYESDRKLLRQYAENTPDPKKTSFNPCREGAKDRPALHALSCMARENNMYIVANVGDIHTCASVCQADGIVEDCGTECPKDGVHIYNTNVAFNREGTLIARYHKMNVYFENLNMEEEDMFITFDTEMGKFGLIVCFDSVFEFSYKLAHEHKIDTMIFPTYWFDDIVPLDGVEWQQSWALSNKVNFFAANTQTPGTGSIGSGIYSKDDGALVYTYDPDNESKLLVANVKLGGGSEKVDANKSITIISEYGAHPKGKETGDNFPEFCYDVTGKGPKSEMSSLVDLGPKAFDTYRCFKSQTEGYTLVKLEKPSDTLEACNDGFCCKITYSAESIKDNFYLAVKNGSNSVHDHYFFSEQVCLLTRCDTFNGKECFLQSSRSNTPFESVELKATFSTNVIYPAVSKNKFRLAPKHEWSVENAGSDFTLKYQSKCKNPLLKVVLYGRCYDRDPPYTPYY